MFKNEKATFNSKNLNDGKRCKYLAIVLNEEEIPNHWEIAKSNLLILDQRYLCKKITFPADQKNWKNLKEQRKIFQKTLYLLTK